MSGQNPQSLMDMLDRMSKLLEDENFLKNLPSMMDAAVNNLENMLENLDSMTQEQMQQLSDMMNQMQQLEQLMNQFPFQGSQRMGMGEAGQILEPAARPRALSSLGPARHGRSFRAQSRRDCASYSATKPMSI